MAGDSNGSFGERKRPAWPSLTATRPKRHKAIIDLTNAEDDGCWDLEVLLDCRELHQSEDRHVLEESLKQVNICFDNKHSLLVGDMLFRARRRGCNQEHVLDILVERKRLTDLKRSLKYRKEGTRRVDEQMFKMESSQLVHKIFLVEKESGLHDAATRSYIQEIKDKHGFHVVETDGVQGTIAFIQKMHESLKAELRRNPPPGPFLTLEALEQRVHSALEACKWRRQLKAMDGVTDDAYADKIMNLFPTEKSLRRAYEIDSRGTGVKLARELDAMVAYGLFQNCGPDKRTSPWCRELEAVKGCSAAMARAVESIYPTKESLRTALRSKSVETVEVLANLRTTSGTKIGRAAAAECLLEQFGREKTVQHYRWSQKLKYMPKVGDERARAIAAVFPSESSLKSTFRGITRQESYDRVKSLPRTGGRVVGGAVAGMLCKKYG